MPADPSAVATSGRALLWLLMLPVFFPYVGIFGGIDIQPFAIGSAIAIVALALFAKSLSVRADYLFLILLTMLAATARAYYQLFTSANDEAVLYALAQTWFHLLTILSIFLLVCSGVVSLSSRLIMIALSVYLIVALLQITIDEKIGSQLVYRGFQELASTGRGVRSLASEPAVFGNMLLVFSGFLILMAGQGRWTRRQFFYSQLGILAASSLLAQSTYVILLQGLVFLVCAMVLSFRLFLLLCAIGFWVLVGLIAKSESEGIRVFLILKTLLDNPLLLYEQGAMLRVLNVPVSVYGSVLHGFFGSGFAPAEPVSGQIPLLPGNPYPFSVYDRAVGGAVELFLRLGFGSLPLLGAMLFHVGRIAGRSKLLSDGSVRLGIPLALVVFLTVFTYSSIGNPMIWLLFFSSLSWCSSRTTLSAIFTRKINATP